MAVLLALVSAVCYGTSDFIGGVLSARIRPWTAAFTGQAAGGLLLAALCLVGGGSPSWSALVWGAVAGLGGGVGVIYLYRGLASGRMGVVAPISGVLAALVPAVVGVAGGDRPSPVSWLGIALALPATWLVASGAESSATEIDAAGTDDAADAGATDAGATDAGARARLGEGVLDGLLAGTGFGIGFAAVAQAPSGSGQWPVVVELLVAAAVAVVGATVGRQAWLPRTPVALASVSTGILAAAAMAAFLDATRHGMLAVTGIIAALYPAATVVLAVLVLRERVHRAQGIGLALCAVAVGLVAGG